MACSAITAGLPLVLNLSHMSGVKDTPTGRDSLSPALAASLRIVDFPIAPRSSEDSRSRAARWELPPEIMCDIFEQLSFRGRLYTTHVCHHWRSSSLTFPAVLWSDIRSFNGVPGVLMAVLERARDTPVDVQVAFTTPALLKDTLSAITAHMYHIRKLFLDWTGETPQWTDVPTSDILGALIVPAPILEAVALDIFDEDRVVPLVPLPANLFAGSAPKLRYATWSGYVDMPASCPAMTAVTTFQSVCEYPSASYITAISSLFPNLERLMMNVNTLFDVPSGVSPLSLKVFDIMFVHGDYRATLKHTLKHFRADTIPCISSPWYDECWTDFRGNGRREIHNLCISSQPPLFSECWKVADNAGHSFTALTPPRFLQEHAPLLNVRSLAIHEEHFNAVNDLPVFPRLSRVCIFVLETIRYRRDDSVWLPSNTTSLLHHSPPEQRALGCPALRHLEFARIRTPFDCEVRCSIVHAPEDVLEFIRNNLSYDAVQLESLAFQGVGLLTTVPVELCRLLAIADAVTVDDTPRSDPLD